MAEDKLIIEVLKDGTIKIISDPISAPNHANATQFFKYIAERSGGTTTQTKRTDKVHEHHHTEEVHEGHSH